MPIKNLTSAPRLSEASFLWGRIAIVEWLEGVNDEQTGRRLFEAIRGTSNEAGRDVHITFYRAPDKASLLSYLADLTQEVKNGAVPPILHIEAHGCPDGIAPDRDGSAFLSWAELRESLTELNRATGFNLLVALAACDGDRAIRLLSPLGPASFFGLVSISAPEVPEDWIVRGFHTFYGEFLDTGDPRAGLREANSLSDAAAFPFVFWSASAAFRLSLAAALLKAAGLEFGESELDLLLQDLDTRPPQPTTAQVQTIETLLSRFPSLGAGFHDAKAKYFMLDEIPSNVARFPVLLQDVLGMRALARANEILAIHGRSPLLG